MLSAPEEALRRLRRRLVEHSNELSGTMKILEAGCGREWGLDLAPADFELTGVDLDSHALEHRRSVTRDLDVGIIGTISAIANIVSSKNYDVIYSAYVLEHIDGAQVALENFSGVGPPWRAHRDASAKQGLRVWMARAPDPPQGSCVDLSISLRKSQRGQTGFQPIPDVPRPGDRS